MTLGHSCYCANCDRYLADKFDKRRERIATAVLSSLSPHATSFTHATAAKWALERADALVAELDK